MKLQFTYTDFKQFESDILNSGFKKYNGKLHNEDYYLAKTLHRSEPDEDGDTCSDLQVFLSVYNFSKYPAFPNDDFMYIQPEINVSRTIEERIDLIVDQNIIKSIVDLEQFAFKFYEFICSNV